ncbi:MAG: hydantoinase/oxoprolinase family protein [Arenicellales bacterium]|jgi:N-methylhydantoinase A|nr:hydantoinase/oxoprolinase family protein [Arenicellales bacterium]MDP6853975.1 hydantoinase/oxoprolinase family protein [Arenicellales bacterium]MDP6947801.1 hydantoinase/oxoprolinase family protein [Arenicellales bacterium]
MGTIRLGVDIGGTFTDLVLLDDKTGQTMVVKVPSQPNKPADALAAAVERALKQAKVPAESVNLLNHGTTIVTNAVLEGNLARTALITTSGFRDVLEIGRHVRPDMYDLNQDKPIPIVPRDLRFEVKERMAPDGNALVPPEPDSVRAAVAAAKASGATAVAIGFLHAYANTEHETAMKAELIAALPEVSVSASSDICREIREFERISTVALNAAAMPVVSRYLEILGELTADLIPKAHVLLMQSNGGSMTVGAARQTPAHLVYSGPAAGVLACQFIGQLTQRPNVLGFDMGGTSTDISLVYRGEPLMTTEADVGGYPVKLPVLDVNTIGAGGGSIAWLDSGGGLRVGPKSAGADPGPVAYQQGGTEPTVTDANLVLGRLIPDRFLGGEMMLDPDAALAAIREKIAEPLGLDPISAAAGILRIANANMERALKVSSAERGYDPRDFSLIAFGGAGPVHAAALAKEVGFASVLVPESPGVFSAFGLLVADLRHDFVRSYMVGLDQVSTKMLTSLYTDLQALGEQALKDDGLAEQRWVFQRTADLRYVGQAYEVNVAFPDGSIGADTVAEVKSRFHGEHQRLFAHSAEDDPVEFVSLRMVATGSVDAPTLRKQQALSTPVAQADTRDVYFEEANGFTACPIYQRQNLCPGAEFQGPAIIEQLDTTTVIHPGQTVSVDDWGSLIIGMEG